MHSQVISATSSLRRRISHQPAKASGVSSNTIDSAPRAVYLRKLAYPGSAGRIDRLPSTGWRMTMNDAVAVVLGAIISGVVGVLVVFFQQKLARQYELDSAKALRLSEFSAAGWAATLIISELARAPIAEKANIEHSERFQTLTDRFNSALAQIQLLDDGEVYAAAHHVDRCLVELNHHARSAEASRKGWRARQRWTQQSRCRISARRPPRPRIIASPRP